MVNPMVPTVLGINLCIGSVRHRVTTDLTRPRLEKHDGSGEAVVDIVTANNGPWTIGRLYAQTTIADFKVLDGGITGDSYDAVIH